MAHHCEASKKIIYLCVSSLRNFQLNTCAAKCQSLDLCLEISRKKHVELVVWCCLEISLSADDTLSKSVRSLLFHPRTFFLSPLSRLSLRGLSWYLAKAELHKSWLVWGIRWPGKDMKRHGYIRIPCESWGSLALYIDQHGVDVHPPRLR